MQACSHGAVFCKFKMRAGGTAIVRATSA